MKADSAVARSSRLEIAGWLLALAAAVLATQFLARGVQGPRLQPLPDRRSAADAGLRADTGGLSPADERVQAAQGMIERAPTDPRGYNALCAAYMQKARETGDFGFNARANAALNRALEIAPDNFDAIKQHAMLLLTYHQFSEALGVARQMEALRPQDHEVYGPLTDALVELGAYDEASRAAQTMIDLRPNTASYARVSYLRALHGDTSGAITAMRLAVQAANPHDPEGVAWCRVHLGYELMNSGDVAAAEREFDMALATFPDYHLALAAKARARAIANDMDAAIALYRRAQNRLPLPDTVIALGDLYAKVGRREDAQHQYDLLEFIERSGAPGSGTYSQQLALFWADHDMRLDDALAIAQRERAVRADIYTCDTLAWCLLKKGELIQAKASIDEAMRLGTRDARIYYHAGMIHEKLGDAENAVRYLKRALETNSALGILETAVARSVLGRIEGGK